MKQLTVGLICFILLITQLPLFNLAQTKSDSTDQQTVEKLDASKPIERDFRYGDNHVYHINLTAGQYFQILVMQHTIDVFVSLFNPAGEKVVEVNNRQFGTEQASLLANATGLYRLEIGSRRSCDPLFKAYCSGKYEMKVIVLRDATEQDKTRIAAQELNAQAKASGPSYSQSVESRAEKIEKLKEVRRMWSSVGEISLEATVLEDIAFEYWSGRDSAKQIEYYSEALKLWKTIGDYRNEANALDLLGNVYRRLGEIQQAANYYIQSLLLNRAKGDIEGEFSSYYTLGSFYNYLNEPRKAMMYYEKALQITRAKNSGNFGALTGMARAYDILGDKQKAREYRLQALAEIQAAGYEPDDPRKILGLARIYGELGEFHKQAEYWEKEAQIGKDKKRSFDEMSSIMNAGVAYSQAGEHKKALDYLNRALLICRTFDRPDLISYLFEYIGNVHRATGDHRNALNHYGQAYRVSSIINNDIPRKTALTYSIARVYRDLDNLNEALIRAEEIISIVESQRANILTPELRRSFFSTAHTYYEFYIDLLMLLHKRNPTSGYAAKALHASERARARALLESLKEARADIRQGIDFELLKRELAAQQRLRSSAERQTRLSIIKHSEAQAAEVKKEVDAATAEYEEVSKQIRLKSPRYAALTQPVPLTASEIQLDLLDADTVLLEYSLGDERSYLWVATPNSLNSYELPKREEIEKHARRIVTFLNDGNRWASDEKINAEYLEAAEHLSQILLPSTLFPQLKGKRLVIVSDGVLRYLPFGALPSPNSKGNNRQPLIVKNEIVSLPSASTLAVLRSEITNRKQVAKSVAVFADPVFSATDERLAKVKASQSKSNRQSTTNFDSSRMFLERAFNLTGESNEPLPISRLPFTRREAEAIFATAPKGLSMKALDFTANRQMVLSHDLSNFRIVHFATHGLLNSEHPELSGIVLSLVNEQGQPVDGFLRLNEIYNMNLSADLVVLSACQTALGKEIRGEGLIGLTRGFMYAGSPRVVASLWKVDDVATAELMKLFYQKMLKEKMRPAAALRAAKVEMWKQKRWNAPFYWAAFEIQGEWR